MSSKYLMFIQANIIMDYENINVALLNWTHDIDMCRPSCFATYLWNVKIIFSHIHVYFHWKNHIFLYHSIITLLLVSMNSNLSTSFTFKNISVVLRGILNRE